MKKIVRAIWAICGINIGLYRNNTPREVKSLVQSRSRLKGSHKVRNNTEYDLPCHGLIRGKKGQAPPSSLPFLFEKAFSL